jgi:glutamate-1-semialdehyde 2,1-aminomutase
MSNRHKSIELFKRAKELMPGGVSSPVRAFKAVGGNPLFLASGNGAYITDVDGQDYIDYLGAFGPLILGHRHPAVVSALADVTETGFLYGAPHSGEVDLASEIVEARPDIEMIRFVNSGTEACMSAIRLARAFTGRSMVVKFKGCYHGHLDALLIKAGSGMLTLALPDSAGVPAKSTENSLLAEFNNFSQLEQLFERHAGEIAAIIVEPVCANTGVILPQDNFLTKLREITSRNQSLLIFDEIVTGFRLSRQGAAGIFGVKPDLVCLGKIIGGGFPIGSYGGKAEIMRMIAPEGPVYQAGTFSGNPVSMATGLATLKQLDSDLYDSLEDKGAYLTEELSKILLEKGMTHCINRAGSMFTLFFGVEAVNDSQSALLASAEIFSKFFNEMLKRGVYLPPSAYEGLFISSAHSRADLDKTLQAARESILRL